MDFFSKAVERLPDSITPDIPEIVKQKLVNFRKFMEDIVPEEKKERIHELPENIKALILAESPDPKATFVFCRMILPKFSEEVIEPKLMELCQYPPEHSNKVRRYLEFFRLAYAGLIDSGP